MSVSSPPGRVRGLLFTLGALLGVPLLLLGLLEGALRAAGFGYEPSFFVERTVAGERVLTDNPRFGWRFFPRALARAPQRFSIPREKPPDTVRICLLGGSAAMGDPEPAFGMPRVLEAVLEAARPDLHFEVVNAAMTAINSHVVLPIARDCVRREADVLVVYLGNNEVVGPFGAGSVFGLPGAGVAIVRWQLCVKSTRIGQLLDEVAGAIRLRRRAPRAWKGMELFLETALEAEDRRLRIVYRNFRSNLEEIGRVATRRGVPVVFASVGVNLRDCAPFRSEQPPRVEGGAGAWEGAFRRGVALEESRAWRAALGAYEAAAAIDEEHAELLFRMARCRWALGDSSGAAVLFQRARDRDVLRFRADSEIEAATRAVAEGRQAEGIYFADVRAALEAASPGGVLGHELFDDHVHLNFHGNVVAGRALARAVLPLLPVSSQGESPEGGRSLTEDEIAERLGYGAWKRARILETFAGRRKLAPFAGQIDREEWRLRIEEERASLRAETQPGRLRRVLASVAEQLRRHPGDAELRLLVAELRARTGDRPGAVREHRALVGRFPYSADAHYGLGVALLEFGRREEGLRELRAAIARSGSHFLARQLLGEELLREGHLEEAGRELERAIASYPDLAVAHRSLGEVRLRQGRLQEAIHHLQRAIEINPSLAAAHKKLGDALSRAGHPRDAAQAYREALRVNPHYTAARERLEALGFHEGSR